MPMVYDRPVTNNSLTDISPPPHLLKSFANIRPLIPMLVTKSKKTDENWNKILENFMPAGSEGGNAT